MKKVIYYIALSGLLLMSCSKSESGVTDSGDGSIQISATRTSSATISDYEGDDLSLSVVYTDNYTPATDDPYTVIDTKWEKDDSGLWSLTDGVYLAALWRNATDVCSIAAFAPYVEHIYAQAGTGVVFDVNLRQDNNNIHSSDFMTCSMESFLPSYVEDLDTVTYDGCLTSSGSVPLNFTHRLSAIAISLTFGDEFDEAYDGADPTVVSVAVNAYPYINYKYSNEGNSPITLLTETDDSSYAKADIYAYKSDTNEYKVIIPPQSFAEDVNLVTIKVDTGGDGNGDDYKDYILTVPTSSSYTFQTGLIYTMSIRVGKDTVKLEEGSITVSDWGTGGQILDDDAELDRPTLI